MDRYHIVGYEGSPNPKYGLTYGAAAIDDGTQIINAVSKLPCRYEDYKEYVENGTVHPTPELHIPETARGCPFMVIYVSRECFAGQSIALALHMNCFACRADEDLNYYYIVAGMEGIENLAKWVVPELEKQLYKVDTEMIATMILTLDHRNKAALNAILPDVTF